MAFIIGSVKLNSKGAVVVSGNGGYGLGNKNLKVTSALYVNRYAKVTAINGDKITLGNVSGTTSVANVCKNSFKAGEEILLHVAAYNPSVGSKTNCSRRGVWKTALIKSVSGDTLTLSKTVSGLVSGFTLDELYVQAITLPHLNTVTLASGGKITCPQFNSSLGYGGVVAFKCKSELVLNGGHIDLAGRGLDDYTLWNKGLVPNEPAAGNDAWRDDVTPTELFYTMAGLENYRTLNHLTLNYPDGAAFIVTKSLVCDSDHKSRIGYVSGAGENRLRVHASRGILGGSSILLAAETINGWTDNNGVGIGAPFISKYPSSNTGNNRGMGRCYIATETVIPTDEGLYALDKISTPTRAAEMFNLAYGFGNGGSKEYSNANLQINSYAQVTAISDDCRTFTLGNMDEGGRVIFKKNALVFLHATKKTFTRAAGRCMFAQVQAYDGQNKLLTIKEAQGFKDFDGKKFNLTRYDVQAIIVPKFTNFNLSGKTYNKVPRFTNGYGGIAVIVANGTCDLRNAKINVEGKGATSYGETGLRFFGNAQMADRLPLGQGHGSVFILAKKLIMDENTRIGATYSGRGQGGLNKRTDWAANRLVHFASNANATTRTIQTNGDLVYYPGQKWSNGHSMVSFDETPYSKTDRGLALALQQTQGRTGGGDGGGVSPEDKLKGGYGSNSEDGGWQGAHVLIIADEIEGFCIDAIATGGKGYTSTYSGLQQNSAGNGGASCGGAGATILLNNFEYRNKNLSEIAFRGGNGGFIGGGSGAGVYSENPYHPSEIPYITYAGGGGSGGFCFVYCNKAVDQDTSNIRFD